MTSAKRPFQKLYDASNEHRYTHGEDCLVFPSPQAPLWGTIASALRVGRILEVGCGLGYQAVCIATASDRCRIETIENTATHAELAQAEFARHGLTDRITILRGEAESILPGLIGPYDLVVEDAGINYEEWLPVLGRLTAPGGLLIVGNLAGNLSGSGNLLPTHAMTLVRSRPTY